jgi:hypothetical protein
MKNPFKQIRFSAAVGVLVIAASSSFAAEPVLKVSIGQRAIVAPTRTVATALRTLPDGSTAVSNVRRIELDVSLAGAGRFGLFTSGGTTDSINLRLKAWKLSGDVREEAPLHVLQQGSGSEYGLPSAKLLLDIPIPEEQRIAETKAYLARIIAASPDTPASLSLKGQTDAVVASFKSLFMQNQTGKFEIVVTYSPHDPAYWRGTLERSIVITIEDDGTFFDALEKRQSPPVGAH